MRDESVVPDRDSTPVRVVAMSDTEHVDRRMALVRMIAAAMDECVDQAQRQGFVETMLKRRRPIADIDSNNPSRRSLAERMAINSVVQGSAADLIKLAMLDLHKRLSPHAGHWRNG